MQIAMQCDANARYLGMLTHSYYLRISRSQSQWVIAESDEDKQFNLPNQEYRTFIWHDPKSEYIRVCTNSIKIV